MSDLAPGWPPLSALAAAVALVLPPGVVTALVLAHDRRPELLVMVVPWLLLAAVGTVGLIRGRTRGYGYAVGAVLLLGTIVVGGAVSALVQGAPPLALTGLAPAVVWLAGTAAFLWWPETRRWCGLLPPADPEL